VVGEKERKTLETLLYTPVTNREFIVAKLSGAFLPGFIISVLAFILYFASGNIVSYLNSGTMIITSLLWVPAMLVLAPAVSALGLSVTLLVSLKAKTFMEAQQISAFVVIPFVILLIMQIAGLLIFNVWMLLGICAVILIIDYVIITRISPRFSRESIVSTL
jgi:ABC-type Na+ efflux pump permease subunit